MPYPFNNVSTADAYSDATSAIFPLPKQGFALNVSNAAIYYQLARPGSTGRVGDWVWDANEYFLTPAYSTFSDAGVEMPGAGAFAGVRVRSAAAGVPAQVTVI